MWGALQKVGPETPAKSWATLAQPWVFEPLIRIGADGVMVPVLAARFELVNPRSLRIWLRGDATFSDGSPLTFDDVATSLAANHLTVAREEGSILVNSGDLAVPIDALLAHAFVYRQTGVGMLGTGPFVPLEQDAAHIVLERRVPKPASIARVRLIAYAKPQEAFAHTLKGDANFLPDVDQRWIEFFEGVARFRVTREPGTHANAVGFNLKRLSRTERIELVHALRSDEVRKLAFGEACLPPARRLEIEPLPSGRPLGVLAFPFAERFALAVRRQLGVRGGDIDVRDLDSIFLVIRGGDFDLLTIRPLTWPPVEALSSLRTGAPTNLLGYSNQEFDSALDRRDWAAAQRALDADPPFAIVCTEPYVTVMDSRIKASIYSPNTMPDWEVAQ